MINLKGKAYAMFLKTIAISGECSISVIKWINDGTSLRNKQYVMKRLLEENHSYCDDEGREFEKIAILKTLGKGSTKSLLLTTKAYEGGILESVGLQEYYDEINYPKVKHRNKFLTKRSKELSILILQIGQCSVIIDPNSKNLPPLNMYQNKDNRSYLYTSREVKYVLDKSNYLDDTQIAYGQYLSFLFAPDSNFIIYNRNKKSSRWNYKSEHRTIVMAREFQDIIYEGKRDIPFDKCLLIGTDDEILDKILNYEDNPKFNTGNVYDYEYFVHQDHVKDILSLITYPKYKDILKKMVFTNKDDKTSGIIYPCDGLTANKEFTLLAFDYELNLMRKFSLASQTHPNEKFAVMCFDWQKPFLSQYFESENVTVSAVTPDTFFTKFKNYIKAKKGK